MPSRPSKTSSPHELRDAYAAMRLGPYLNDLWVRREYMIFVARSELRSRQMSSVLGNLWHLLNPALQIAIYFVIFGVFLDGVRRGVDNYILFLAIGVFMFADVQRATIAGGGSILNNRGILQAVKFPRALLPITAALTEFLATLPSILIIFPIALLTGESPRWTWIALPLVVVGQFVFDTGLALIAARATSHFGDVLQILPFVFRLLIYTSGVIFQVDSFANGRPLAWIFDLNPIYAYLSIGRWTIMGGRLDTAWLVCAGLWTIGALVLGFFWFRQAEESYGHN